MENELSFEERVQRIADILEIYHLQGRYMHWLSLGQGEDVIATFATNLPNVSAEAGDSGVMRGESGIRRLFGDMEAISHVPGQYTENQAVNPVVGISKDGKRAKGVWFSPGITTDAQRNLQGWEWGKYDNDYVKVDGEWKILHLRWYQTFETTYEKGWLLTRRLNM